MSVSWQQAVVVACAFALAALAARLAVGRGRGRGRIVADVLLEGAVLFALYAVWQLALDFTVTSTKGAVAHGRWVWRVERALHLPGEKSVQGGILSHRTLVSVLNQYYLLAHYGGLLICLAWVFLFHRRAYRWSRRMLVLTTVLLTVPFQSSPVAPPRLLLGLGVVDTAHPGSSAAVAAGLRDPGQLTAMPSVHVAWAVLVAVCVIRISTSRWRWLTAGYPVLTMMVVVWTGNHFWADGIVSAAIVAVVVLADRVVFSGGMRLGEHRPAVWRRSRAMARSGDGVERGPVARTPTLSHHDDHPARTGCQALRQWRRRRSEEFTAP